MTPPAPGETWRPSAPLGALEARARLLATVRSFFAERGVLEVETPALAATTAPDPNIESLSVDLGDGRSGYLQTSPEHAMKRLLAAGSGPIYEMARAFRAGESGRHHNREFTLLEWYRPGFDHHALMDEVDALIARVLRLAPGRRLTYREVFERHAALDPFASDDTALRAACVDAGMSELGARELSRDQALDLVLATRIQPLMGPGTTFVFDYPASQAALARIRPGQPALAERFEVFVDGIEIANGYHELTDGDELARRFEADRRLREDRGQADVAPDGRLLAALEHGLPACAGVALGLDRLLMLDLQVDSIAAVIAFTEERA